MRWQSCHHLSHSLILNHTTRRGLRRPAAILHKPSVLVPQARKRDAPSDEPTRDEVDRTCYLCFEFSGKAREECYMKKVSGDYTTGHRGTKTERGLCVSGLTMSSARMQAMKRQRNGKRKRRTPAKPRKRTSGSARNRN